MARLWLLCGLAFAGKTTLRHMIVRLTGAVSVCPDDINAERGLRSGDGVPDEEWGRTHAIALHRAEEALTDGLDVVIDDTNCFRWLRDDYREVAEGHGADVTVVALEVPLDEIRRRMERNEVRQQRPVLRADLMQRLIDTFEWPTEDENVMGAEQLLERLRDHRSDDRC